MSSTRHVKNCCCQKMTCGLCSSSTPDKYYYCLEKTTVGGNTENPKEPIDDGYYGGSCPYTEVMQICIDPYALMKFYACSPWGDHPENPDTTSWCEEEQNHCWRHSPVVQEAYAKEFAIFRDDENPCKWLSDGWIDVDGCTDMHCTSKPCEHSLACECDPSARWWKVVDTDVITMGYQFKAEVRLTPYCIQDTTDEYNMGHPIGTCGRLVEVRIDFRFNNEPHDNPACARTDSCLSYRDLFATSSGKPWSPYMDNVPLNYRGRIGRASKFFPSCGCLPYCYQDDDCTECGDYGCFNEDFTPVITEEASKRDRWCNGKDCGEWGCCEQVLRTSGQGGVGVEECAYCIDEEDSPKGIPPWNNCADEKVRSGYGDECGRGQTWDRTFDDGAWLYLLEKSNTPHPVTGTECTTSVSNPRYLGCCGELDNEPAPCTESTTSEWLSGWGGGLYVPPEKHPSGWYLKGLSCSWRFVAS